MSIPEQIEFNRPAKYKLIESLGNGACGETIRVHDANMECDFVVKKYRPFITKDENPSLFVELLLRFKTEAKILFRLNHPNIVRVYNYFDYPEHNTAYIMMEYVNGIDIMEHIKNNYSSIDSVFKGVLEGFCHLEAKNVLHRDIRPANILIDEEGTAKIIDFGFGKVPQNQKSDEKSISLNWWCETPPDFLDATYDFQTEIYFVGKLFQYAIQEYSLIDFKYKKIVHKMCTPRRTDRYKSFADIKHELAAGDFAEIAFSNEEERIYRDFVAELISVIVSIQTDAKLESNVKRIESKLQSLYRSAMLEQFLSDPVAFARVFVYGNFTYRKNSRVEVSIVKGFILFLRTLSNEKSSIVVENIAARLSALPTTQPSHYDEIPF